MTKSIVSILRTGQSPGYEEIRETVRQAVAMAGGISGIVKAGSRVLINPNLVAPPGAREYGVVTQAEVSRAVADLVRDAGGKPIIAESAAVGVDTEKVMAEAGYHDLRDLGYEVVDLKGTKDMVMQPVQNGVVFDAIQVFRLLKEVDVIISVPKLKTHDQVEITCSIKNLKGLESDAHKRKTHKIGLVPGVVDLMTVIKPAFAIVDGIIAQEGLAPVYGHPVEMDLIVAGQDLVAVDAVCGRIIGYDPAEVPITVEAAKRGLGEMNLENIEVRGVPIREVERRFLRAVEDNPVEVEGFNLFSDDDTCTGCRNTVMSALNDMRNAGQAEYLKDVAVITGKAVIPEGLPKKMVVAVGNCVPKDRRGQHFVEGCPPNNALVVDAILSGRAEAKRMYADKGLKETEKQ